MDSILSIVGVAIILVALILIIKNKKRDIPSDDIEYKVEGEDIDFEDELELIKNLEEIEHLQVENEKKEDPIIYEKNNKELIELLYREGYSESEIAKKLEIGIREVDIVLKVNNLKK